MRTSTLSAAALLIATVTTVATANDDFSALLADLSFSDVPTLNESLAVVETETVDDELKPAPGEFVMPEITDQASLPEAAAGSDAAVVSEATVAPEAPQIALSDPVPASTPESLGNVDFDAVFAVQDRVPTQSVGHTFGHSAHGCEEDIFCTPRNPVNLPSSTLLQYFRSSVCNTNVWDGYRVKCHDYSKHLHGGGCGANGCTSCDATCD